MGLKPIPMFLLQLPQPSLRPAAERVDQRSVVGVSQRSA
jgi:hypothetical protein